MRHLLVYSFTFALLSVTVLSAVTVLPLCQVCDDELPCQPGTVCVDNLCVEIDLPFGEECDACRKCGPFLECQYGKCWSPNPPESDCGGQCGSLNYACKEGLTCVDEICECQGTLVCNDENKCVADLVMLTAATPEKGARSINQAPATEAPATTAFATEGPPTKGPVTEAPTTAEPATASDEDVEPTPEEKSMPSLPKSLCGEPCGFAGYTCADGLQCATFSCACGDNEACNGGVCMASDSGAPSRPPSPCGGYCGWSGFTCEEGLTCDAYRCACAAGEGCNDGNCTIAVDPLAPKTIAPVKTTEEPATKASAAETASKKVPDTTSVMTMAPATETSAAEVAASEEPASASEEEEASASDSVPPLAESSAADTPRITLSACGGYCGLFGYTCEEGLECDFFRCACASGEKCGDGVCSSAEDPLAFATVPVPTTKAPVFAEPGSIPVEGEESVPVEVEDPVPSIEEEVLPAEGGKPVPFIPRSLCGQPCGVSGFSCSDGLTCAEGLCACGANETCNRGVCSVTVTDSTAKPAPRCGGYCGWLIFRCEEGAVCERMRCACASGVDCDGGICAAPAESPEVMELDVDPAPGEMSKTLPLLLEATEAPDATSAPAPSKCGGYCAWNDFSCEAGLSCEAYRCACPKGEMCKNGVCA